MDAGENELYIYTHKKRRDWFVRFRHLNYFLSFLSSYVCLSMCQQPHLFSRSRDDCYTHSNTA